MAMTKRYKVTFEVTHTLTTEEEKKVDILVLESARSLSKGEWDHGLPKAFCEGLVLAALSGGKEAAVEYVVTSGIREYLRGELKEDGFKFSPDVVRAIK